MIDVVGHKFGRLTILKIGPVIKKNRTVFVRCDCGTERQSFWTGIRTGRIKSCGCLGKEVARELCRVRNRTHGRSGTREYRIYKNIATRCFNPKSVAYANYGAKGITMCKRWQGKNGFQNFFADMGPQPTPKHTIDRRDNKKGYSPDNCRWSTRAEQSRNTRRNRMLSHNGEILCLKDLAKRFNMSIYQFMAHVLCDGWPE